MLDIVVIFGSGSVICYRTNIDPLMLDIVVIFGSGSVICTELDIVVIFGSGSVICYCTNIELCSIMESNGLELKKWHVLDDK